MKVKVRKIGHSLGFYIPKRSAQLENIKAGTILNIEVIKKTRRRRKMAKKKNKNKTKEQVKESKTDVKKDDK